MFYSQFGQDKFLYETYFKDLPVPGVFVEIGASDGVRFSNTFFFEKEKNWSGLCIEASERNYNKLVENRNCFCENACVHPEQKQVEFLDIEGWGQGCSGIVENYSSRSVMVCNQNQIVSHPEYVGMKRVRKDTTTIMSLLEKYCLYRIHYLSLDIEGGEMELFESIDHSRVWIDVVTIENNFNDPFEPRMNRLGFHLVKRLGVDEVYVHQRFINRSRVVKFHCLWTDSETLFQEYKTMLPTGVKNWMGVQVGEDPEYHIVIEGTRDKQVLDTDKPVVYLQREPGTYAYGVYPFKNIIHRGCYEDGWFHCVPQLNFLDKTIDDILFQDKYPDKINLCSAIISNKTYTPFLVQRDRFASRLAEIPDIHVFGQGRKPIPNKSMGLDTYRYSICVENSRIQNYFSEKFTDCILSWTIPIYDGCPNIHEFFPPDCYHLIDITHPNVNQHIQDILQQPITTKQIKALHHARNLILSRYNIWPYLSSILP